MATVTIETQAEGNISKFYLDTLRWLQIEGLDHESENFSRFYYSVRDLINPNTRFTSLDKLGPSLLYMFLKRQGILLILPDFLNLYGIKYYEFTRNLKKVLKIYPEYNARNKISIIRKYIATILKSFNVEERIISHANTLFDHFYPLVQYTKEEIVAAIICTLTAISFDLTEINMRFICDRAGICQSSLNKSIIRNIFPYLGIPDNFKLKSSFDLIKGKIRKKTSLAEIKTRTIEEEIVDLWSSGFSIAKIIELVEVSKNTIINVLEDNLGDFRSYKIRYRITQQEIDAACLLRKKGLSYREIVPRIHRPLSVVKKIIEANLEDHAKYRYIPRRDRIKYAKLGNLKVYASSEPVVQFYYDLLRKIKIERSQKISLSKLAYLLLRHEDRIKKNITKTVRYLSEIDIHRAEKTVLGVVLALSFPQIPTLHVANLIGVSPTAIRANLAIEQLKPENIAAHFDLVVKQQINLESIFDYLAIIATLIREGRIPQVEPKALNKILRKLQPIEADVRDITKILRKKGLYRDEALILATSIYRSCPSLNRETIRLIITGAINRKVKFDQITRLQKDMVDQKKTVLDQSSLLEQLGELLEERETDVLCAKCGRFVHLKVHSNNQKIFACKHCLSQ